MKDLEQLVNQKALIATKIIRAHCRCTLRGLVGAIFAGLLLLPTVKAVSPPPDGGYANQNTAEGEDALFSLTTGSHNTAIGFNALFSNTTGYDNTAIGYNALRDNTTGGSNVAIGAGTLPLDTTGGLNTAVGMRALNQNTTGQENTAIGFEALMNNTSGNLNVGIGPAVGGNLTTGSENILIGWGAGSTISDGSNNIVIGSPGRPGESSTIRIGSQIRKTYIAGISASAVNGMAVVVSNNGQLGVAPSSARYKTGLKSMGRGSEAVLSLRPVTFHYKEDLDPGGIPQFGLVAEEVAKVDPDLVMRDEQGKPFTVRYDAVNAMLLNEFIKEHRQVQELETMVLEQQAQIKAQTAALEKQARQIQQVSARLEANSQSSRLMAENRTD